MSDVEGTCLAEVNIARLIAPMDDPRVAEFVNAVDRVNALAERSPGFIWRWVAQTPEQAEAAQAGGDPRVIATLSVWRDVESLENFVFKTVHGAFFRNRAKWFETMEMVGLAMWRVAPDHRPDFDEARARLAHLNAHGDSDFAFGWAHVKEARLWRGAQRAAE